MTDLDQISVLPKMSSINEKDRTFRLVWVLDLVSDSSRTWINLIFQNIKTNYILIDAIPPELLSYCTIGSHFRNGRKLPNFTDGVLWKFTIESNKDSQYLDAGAVLTDEEYCLSLNNTSKSYTNICRQQYCFVQDLSTIKVIIPCFVISSVFYFRSTSLREAVLARKVPALSESCSVDGLGLATIYLKPGANLSDAQTIARLLLDPFAQQRLNLCKNHHYSSTSQAYSRIYVEFPVEQSIQLKARGIYTRDYKGKGTFVVCQIHEEDSNFPFDAIDIYYQGQEKGDTDGPQGNFAKKNSRHNRHMTNRSPSSGLVRQLLENSKIARNSIQESIIENRIAVLKPSDHSVFAPFPKHSEDQVSLSSQLETPSDQPIARAQIKEKETYKSKFEFSLGSFIRMVEPLRNQRNVVTVNKRQIELNIRNFCIQESVVPRRYKEATRLSIKESYDHTLQNRRRYASISFECNNQHVCIIEIDQTSIGNARCSTRVLISDQTIPAHYAEDCVRDYALGIPLALCSKSFKLSGIALHRRNHPQRNDEALKTGWRAWLLTLLL